MSRTWSQWVYDQFGWGEPAPEDDASSRHSETTPYSAYQYLQLLATLSAVALFGATMAYLGLIQTGADTWEADERTTGHSALRRRRLLDLDGTAGPDNLTGTTGPDVLNGLGGFDYLDGRGGLDVLSGGDGGATYVYRRGYGTLYIDDYYDSLERHSIISLPDMLPEDIKLFGWGPAMPGATGYAARHSTIKIQFHGNQSEKILLNYQISPTNPTFVTTSLRHSDYFMPKKLTFMDNSSLNLAGHGLNMSFDIKLDEHPQLRIFYGTNYNDFLNMTPSVDNHLEGWVDCVALSGDDLITQNASISYVRIFGGDGDDSIFVRNSESPIRGGPGFDIIESINGIAEGSDGGAKYIFRSGYRFEVNDYYSSSSSRYSIIELPTLYRNNITLTTWDSSRRGRYSDLKIQFGTGINGKDLIIYGMLDRDNNPTSYTPGKIIFADGDEIIFWPSSDATGLNLTMYHTDVSDAKLLGTAGSDNITVLGARGRNTALYCGEGDDYVTSSTVITYAGGGNNKVFGVPGRHTSITGGTGFTYIDPKSNAINSNWKQHLVGGGGGTIFIYGSSYGTVWIKPHSSSNPTTDGSVLQFVDNITLTDILFASGQWVYFLDNPNYNQIYFQIANYGTYDNILPARFSDNSELRLNSTTPLIIKTSLSINVGASTPFYGLQIYSKYSNHAYVLFSNITHGYFHDYTDPTESVAAYRYQDLLTSILNTTTNAYEKTLYFRHDGSNEAPSFNVQIEYTNTHTNEPTTYSEIVPASITFNPTLINNKRIVVAPQPQSRAVLTSDMLSATYEGVLEPQLEFIIDSTSGAFFHDRCTSPSDDDAVITQFSQQAILDACIEFVVTSSSRPTYSLHIGPQNGFAETLPVEGDVNLYAPVVTFPEVFPVTEGASTTLSDRYLSATDADGDSDGLIVRFLRATFGRFSLASAPDIAVFNTTLSDILSNNLLFIHDGREVAPSIELEVTDGQRITGPFNLMVNFTGVGDPLQLVNVLPPQYASIDNPYRLIVGERFARDPDDPISFSLTHNTNWLSSRQLNGSAVEIFGTPTLEDYLLQSDVSATVNADNGNGIVLSGPLSISISPSLSASGLEQRLVYREDEAFSRFNPMIVDERASSVTNLNLIFDPSVSNTVTLRSESPFPITKNSDGSYTIRGSEAKLNAFLQGLLLKTPLDYNQNFDIRLRLSDGGVNPDVLGRLTFTGIPINDGPFIVTDLIPEEVPVFSNETNLYSLPSGFCVEKDVADPSRYSAKMRDGRALLPWISFNSEALSVTLSPETDDVGAYVVGINCSDTAGAYAIALFRFQVNPPRDKSVTVNRQTNNVIINGENLLTPERFFALTLFTLVTLSAAGFAIYRNRRLALLKKTLRTLRQSRKKSGRARTGTMVKNPVIERSAKDSKDDEFDLSTLTEKSIASQSLALKKTVEEESLETIEQGLMGYLNHLHAYLLADKTRNILSGTKLFEVIAALRERIQNESEADIESPWVLGMLEMLYQILEFTFTHSVIKSKKPLSRKAKESTLQVVNDVISEINRKSRKSYFSVRILFAAHLCRELILVGAEQKRASDHAKSIGRVLTSEGKVARRLYKSIHDLPSKWFMQQLLLRQTFRSKHTKQEVIDSSIQLFKGNHDWRMLFMAIELLQRVAESAHTHHKEPQVEAAVQALCLAMQYDRFLWYKERHVWIAFAARQALHHLEEQGIIPASCMDEVTKRQDELSAHVDDDDWLSVPSFSIAPSHWAASRLFPAKADKPSGKKAAKGADTDSKASPSDGGEIEMTDRSAAAVASA